MSVSNHQPHDCLLNRLFRRRSKKISKLRPTGLCVWNSPVTGEFPAQVASNKENISMWWRHNDKIYSMKEAHSLLMLCSGVVGLSAAGGACIRTVPPQIPQCTVPYLTMHHFGTEMCTHAHIFVRKWCIVGYFPDAMWDMWDGFIPMVLQHKPVVSLDS